MDIKFTNYGQKREVNCTEAEMDIFHIILSLCDDENLNADNIELVQKSDNYVSAVMPSSKGYGDMDLARFKFTDRAKWIKLAPSFEKIPLHDTEGVTKIAEDVLNAYRFNEPYL